jgi:hypothetical protein
MMGVAILILVTVAFAGGLWIGWAWVQTKARVLEREKFIRTYVFSRTLLEAPLKMYPFLEKRDLFLVARALRSYFLLHARAQSVIGMPSRIVDVLWHEFILDTRAYHAFCRQAFGTYFHHLPASKATAADSSDAAMRTTWRLACLEENIDPRAATRLPLLFAIDEKLKIPDGNRYRLTQAGDAAAGDGAGCSAFACSGKGLAGSDGSHGGSDGCDASGSDGGGDSGGDGGCAGDCGGCGGGCGGD